MLHLYIPKLKSWERKNPQSPNTFQCNTPQSSYLESIFFGKHIVIFALTFLKVICILSQLIKIEIHLLMCLITFFMKQCMFSRTGWKFTQWWLSNLFLATTFKLPKMISIKQCFSQSSGNLSTWKSVSIHIEFQKLLSSYINNIFLFLFQTYVFVLSQLSNFCISAFNDVCISQLLFSWFTINTEQPQVEKMCVLAKFFTYSYTVRCEDR